jgi:hypothetical protein
VEVERWLVYGGLANFMTPGNHAIKQSCTPTPQTLSSGLNRKQKWSQGWGEGGGGYHERKSDMKHSLQMKVYYTVQYPVCRGKYFEKLEIVVNCKETGF